MYKTIYSLLGEEKEAKRKLDNSDDEIREEISTVSRPIDQAISAFAPGASITKDKHVLTAIGFSQASLVYGTGASGRPVIKTKGNPDAPVFPLRMTFWECSNPSCNNIITELPDNILNLVYVVI